jgi:DnaJ-class molecular chaperone
MKETVISKSFNMKANIYKQSFDKVSTIDITEENIKFGFIQRDCMECDGTGLFKMPDENELKCNACKGSGKRWVSLV